jgi:Rieske Fe-S protein
VNNRHQIVKRARTSASRDRELCAAACTTRRAILKTGATGVLLAVLPAGCVSDMTVPSGPIAAGNVSALSLGTLQIIRPEDVVIGRDAGGLYAMSALCTHAGCVLSVVGGTGAKSLSCGCHGSTFDSIGAVTNPPAATPLRHYQVDVAADGSVIIRGDLPVAADARTPVA